MSEDLNNVWQALYNCIKKDRFSAVFFSYLLEDFLPHRDMIAGLPSLLDDIDFICLLKMF